MNETSQGTPIALGERVLTPVSEAFRVRLPGAAGALVWSRPLRVELEERGLRRFVRVPDPTRKIQLGLLAAGLAAGTLIVLLRSRHSRRRWLSGGNR